jgi:hypothetical protein
MSDKAERLLTEQPLDFLEIRRRDHLVLRQATRPSGGLRLEEVATVSLLAHDLAAPCNPDTLLGTGVRLVLWHSAYSPYLAPDQSACGVLGLGAAALVAAGLAAVDFREAAGLGVMV